MLWAMFLPKCAKVSRGYTMARSCRPSRTAKSLSGRSPDLLLRSTSDLIYSSYLCLTGQIKVETTGQRGQPLVTKAKAEGEGE